MLDDVVQELEKGKKFDLVLDSIDCEVKVHDMRSDKQNTRVHTVATSFVFDHLSSYHLLDNDPPKSLAECEMRDLIKLTELHVDKRGTRSSLERSCVTCFPLLSF